MKPTIQQQDNLRNYLRKNLYYRETYIEFYDHIISALENKPNDMNFQDAVDSIVNEDFGGYNGMSAIEIRYKKEITSEIKNKYLTYLIEYFKYPLIGITATLAMLFYWMTKQPWFGFGTFIIIIAVMRITPGLVRYIRDMISGYVFTRPKSSVKDSVFKWLDYIPVILFIVFIISHALNTSSPQEWYKNASPIALSLTMLVFAIHTLTYFRIYKNEFKTSITQ